MRSSRYGQFFATPGVARLFGSTLVGRLPSGMLSLALVLRLTQGGRSYAVAGVVVGAYTLAAGVSSPVLSRIVDRFGQPVVLVPAAIATLAACSVDASIPTTAPTWALLLGSVAIGVAMPPLAGASRSMWPFLLADANVLEAAYVTDATFQELVFIAGPLLVVGIAALAGTGSALIAAGVMGCTGTCVFATSAGSRRWRSTASASHRRHALSSPGIRVLVLTMFAVVAGFGATDVAIVASARSAGHAGYSGIVLAVWSGGSMLGGLIYGARRWPGTAAGRVVVLLAATTVLTAILVPVHALLLIAVVMAVGGANCAPALSGIYHSAQAIALPGSVTESYAWIGVGTLAGTTVGTSVAGLLITQHGPGAGFAFGAVAVAVGGAVVLLGRRSLATPTQPVPTSLLVPAGS
jgi:MFS family permease